MRLVFMHARACNAAFGSKSYTYKLHLTLGSPRHLVCKTPGDRQVNCGSRVICDSTQV